MFAADGLTVFTPQGLPLLHDVALRLPPRSLVALLGPSGSGKSTLIAALAGILPHGWRVENRSLHRVRLGLSFQAARNSLDPLMDVGAHFKEVCAAHRLGPWRDVAVGALSRVGSSDPERWLRLYPHQLSGGMSKRISLALALVPSPEVLLLDEPTSGLDPIAADALFTLLRQLRDEGLGILMATHDPRAAASADQILRIEQGTLIAEDRLAAYPQPSMTRKVTRDQVVVLEASGLMKRYGRYAAIDDVSLTLSQGERLAVIGPSGAGKSTLARLLVGLEQPTAGTLRIAPDQRPQLVFQDTTASLNPLMRVGDALLEPTRVRSVAGEGMEVLRHRAGVAEGALGRGPLSLSGGERQRVQLVRALSAKPGLLVLDEPTAELDVAAKAAVDALVDDLEITIVLITHDLTRALTWADRIAVLDGGRLVELGSRQQVSHEPRHPTTMALMKTCFAVE